MARPSRPLQVPKDGPLGLSRKGVQGSPGSRDWEVPGLAVASSRPLLAGLIPTWPPGPGPIKTSQSLWQCGRQFRGSQGHPTTLA